jgi:hypothetical protein
VNGAPFAAVIAMLLAQAPQVTFAPGQVVASVATAADSTQTYALYLPSQYRADRAWPLLMAFHPGARGRAFVDLYREVAEEYGYIVAASNVSRNGPWAPSLAAAQAMTQDVGARFSIDPARFYMTGFSGGARVAMQLALTSGKIAGVIASGGGFPDAQPRREVGFDVAGTVGVLDFNYLELRSLDRELASPHRVFTFDDGHTMPPADIARRALEWLELRAIVRGTRPADTAVIERWFNARVAAADRMTEPHLQATALNETAQDFRGLRDVSGIEKRAQSILSQRDVARALDQERDREEAEARLLRDIVTLESQLRHPETRAQGLAELRKRLREVHARAVKKDDSADRRSARRVLSGISSGAAARVNDADYLKLLQEFRITAG